MGDNFQLFCGQRVWNLCEQRQDNWQDKEKFASFWSSILIKVLFMFMYMYMFVRPSVTIRKYYISVVCPSVTASQHQLKAARRA